LPGSLEVDTIAILASANDEPGAEPAASSRTRSRFTTTTQSARPCCVRTLDAHAANGVTEPPTLLRTVRTETGERRLSALPDPTLMTVRSPYAERTWRTVRTEDWSSSGGLLGLRGDIALPAGHARPHARPAERARLHHPPRQ
jgi:hypothetical protein